MLTVFHGVNMRPNISLLIFFLFFTSSQLFAISTITEKSRQAYIFGYPLVISSLTREYGKDEINKFSHMRELPKASYKKVVKPNFDTLYSTAWLDLSKGPVFLTLPEVKDRYFQVQLLDAWTHVFSSLGTRTSGISEQSFIIVGPNWKGKVDEGSRLIHSPTQDVWIIGRTEVKDESDLSQAHAIQDGYKLVPTRVSHDKSVFSPADQPPVQYLESMKAKEFYKKLKSLLINNPPHPQDKSKIDLEFINDLGNISQLQEGIEKGRQDMIQGVRNLGNIHNGWRILTNLGDYGTDYLRRAIIAKIGLGANLAKDALYPTSVWDRNGEPLHGTSRYTIHFDNGNLPPTKAFWSITIYDKKGFLVENRHKRYALGSRDNLSFNPDGSLDIYLQNNPPTHGDPSNWLPIPRDRFTVTMRIYWPGNEVLTHKWVPPQIEQR